MANINWFPGHMVKTRREIKENLKLVDAVIEMRDARIVKSSKNPEVDELIKNKPRIILLNKYDLCDEKISKMWCDKLNNEYTKTLLVNCNNGEGLNKVKGALNILLKEKHDRLKLKGLVNITTRAMVVGIPNVGKSTFINKMAKNKVAKTGDRPGVTKSKQWIKAKDNIELLDTPGILWPKFEDDEVALNLAFTGAIKDEIMDIEELCYEFVKRMQETNNNLLANHFKIDCIDEDPNITIEKIARKRGAIRSGNQIDINRISVLIMDEFRGGLIGRISLERP